MTEEPRIPVATKCSRPRPAITKLLWRVMYAVFFSMCVWILAFELWLGAQREGTFFWILKAIDLPIAALLAPFRSLYYLDFWFPSYRETHMPSAVYEHMKTGTIAYLAFFYLVEFFWKQAKRLLAAIRPAVDEDRKRGHTSAIWFRALGVGRLALAAITLTLGIWLLNARPIEAAWYTIALDGATVLDLPIAIAGLVLPADLRGLDLWFPKTSPPWLLHLLLPGRLIAGTVVYLSIFYLVALFSRRTGITRLVALVAARIEVWLDRVTALLRPSVAKFLPCLAYACALSGATFLMRDLPAGLPSGKLIGWLAALLEFPVTTFWQAVFFLKPPSDLFPGKFYYHMFLGIVAYTTLLGLASLIFAYRKARPSVGNGSPPPRLIAKVGRIGIAAFLVAGASWYIAASPVASPSYWLVRDVLFWIDLPVMWVVRFLPWEVGGFDTIQTYYLAPRLGSEIVLQRLVLATCIYGSIFSLFSILQGKFMARKHRQDTSPFQVKAE